jgi:transposase
VAAFLQSPGACGRDKVFVDYSGKKIPIVDRKTGEIREAEIFVAVLGASSFTYAEATWTQTLPDWIKHPCGYLRTARGRCGSLRLHRNGPAPSTPCRSPAHQLSY